MRHPVQPRHAAENSCGRPEGIYWPGRVADGHWVGGHPGDSNGRRGALAAETRSSGQHRVIE